MMEKIFMMKEPFLVFLQNQYQNSFVYMKARQGVGWKGEDSFVIFTSYCPVECPAFMEQESTVFLGQYLMSKKLKSYPRK